MELGQQQELDYRQLADTLPHIDRARENNTAAIPWNKVLLERADWPEAKKCIFLFERFHIQWTKLFGLQTATYIVHNSNIDNSGSIAGRPRNNCSRACADRYANTSLCWHNALISWRCYRLDWHNSWKRIIQWKWCEQRKASSSHCAFRSIWREDKKKISVQFVEEFDSSFSVYIHKLPFVESGKITCPLSSCNWKFKSNKTSTALIIWFIFKTIFYSQNLTIFLLFFRLTVLKT